MTHRLPFLRASIERSDKFTSPRGAPRARPVPPVRDRAAHVADLLSQLDALAASVGARPERVPEATRELVHLQAGVGAQLVIESLASQKGDVRIAAVDESFGSVLIDTRDLKLDALRKKALQFGDPSKDKTAKSGQAKARHAALIAPIEIIDLPSFEHRPRGRLVAERLDPDTWMWFELECRGGYRSLIQEDSARTLAQLRSGLYRLGGEPMELYPAEAAERLFVFARLSCAALKQLIELTDCIYDFDLAPPAIRDWRLLETNPSARDLSKIKIAPPPENAPSVVVLDTGIASSHPLLSPALLPGASGLEAIDGDTSAEDLHGHGTEVAGVALYADLGASIESGHHQATHWLQSGRLLRRPRLGTAAPSHEDLWPVITEAAVTLAEHADPVPERPRVFVSTITAPRQQTATNPGSTPTSWSHVFDQLAYNRGQGRLIILAGGDLRDSDLTAMALDYPELQFAAKHDDPAQASNALTVGAMTSRTTLPPGPEFAELRPVAPSGGLSPYTCTGALDAFPRKPDLVCEGGNLALGTGAVPFALLPTLSALTTGLSSQGLGPRLSLIAETSEAAAHAARLAAEVWSLEPDLRPETVRALLVHASSWTPAMTRAFPKKRLDDRLAACGLGVPDPEFARACARDRATIIVESQMANRVRERRENPTGRRGPADDQKKIDFFRLPVPDSLGDTLDPEVELRVTLSYFAEPSRLGRKLYRGLDLRWDMQGPQEGEAHFIDRINKAARPLGADGKARRAHQSKGLKWTLGVNRRAAGTVQSDRWRGHLSLLSGPKLIAVYPVGGWWDNHKRTKFESLRYSLVVSLVGPDIYSSVAQRLVAPIVT